MIFFRCYHGHIIGEIHRINGISKLMVYDRPEDEARQLRVVITGSAEVVCIRCGEMRHWHSDRLITSLDTRAII
jgi:hypothetical protein